MKNKQLGCKKQMYKCEELNKLEKWLKENKIEYHDNSDKYIERIAITHFSEHKDEYWLSAVCSKINMGTWGSEKGLIEFWNMVDEPIGYLTAKEVIKKIKKRAGKMKYLIVKRFTDGTTLYLSKRKVKKGRWTTYSGDAKSFNLITAFIHTLLDRGCDMIKDWRE